MRLLARMPPSGEGSDDSPLTTHDSPPTAYALSLQAPTGGFRGGAWDNGTDVEYTFYGLGTLALLSSNW